MADRDNEIFGISDNEIAPSREPQATGGFDPNRMTSRWGSIGNNRSLGQQPSGASVYGPWRGEGLRVELRRIPGVTDARALPIPFRFQCPPMDSFQVDTAAVATDYDTIDDGQFSRLSGTQLSTVSFRTLVVQSPEPWVLTRGLFNPKKTSRRLRRLMAAGTPVRLVAWHKGPVVELNLKVTLRSLSITEQAGENDARYYDVSFTQWRDPIVRRRVRKQWPKKHKLQQGDTLARLAKKYYGKPTLARQIAAANKHLNKWGKNTAIVKSKHYKVGQVLEIPAPLEMTSRWGE